MEQRQNDRWTQLVTQGKITELQKQAIINELAALRTKYDPVKMKDLSPTDRKTQMDNEQNELKTWAQAQGIDLSLIRPGRGMMGFRGGKHWNNQPSPTPTN